MKKSIMKWSFYEWQLCRFYQYKGCMWTVCELFMVGVLTLYGHCVNSLWSLWLVYQLCMVSAWTLHGMWTLFGYQLVSWCFEPSQQQRIISGLKANFNLSPSHCAYESLNQTTIFFFFTTTLLKYFTYIQRTIFFNSPRETCALYKPQIHL